MNQVSLAIFNDHSILYCSDCDTTFENNDISDHGSHPGQITVRKCEFEFCHDPAFTKIPEGYCCKSDIISFYPLHFIDLALFSKPLDRSKQLRRNFRSYVKLDNLQIMEIREKAIKITQYRKRMFNAMH